MGAKRGPNSPGWYPSPDPDGAQRYWDGHEWTDSVAEFAVATDAPGTGVDPSFAWALALIPLLGGPAYYFAPKDVALMVTWIGIWGMTWLLARADSNRLRSAGIRTAPSLALLGGICYLAQRTRAARSTLALPVVWLATTAIYVAVVVSVGAVASYDPAAVEADIESGLASEGVPGAQVSCPEIRGTHGDQFECTASFGSESVEVVVTLTAGGGYRWHVR